MLEPGHDSTWHEVAKIQALTADFLVNSCARNTRDTHQANYQLPTLEITFKNETHVLVVLKFRLKISENETEWTNF